MNNEKIFDELLVAWEDTYKKGQFTLWVMLALRDGEKYVDEILAFIQHNSSNNTQYEEQSLYRLLRKFQHIGLVDFSTGKGNKGPERKYYQLTDLGQNLLTAFIERNIKLFFNDNIQKLINLGGKL